MRSSDQEKLLDDLLRDPNYESFRAEVYDLSMAEFRAHRRRRPAPFYLGLAASILVIGLVAFALRNPKDISLASKAASVTSIAEPVPDGEAKQTDGLSVQTVPLSFSEVVRSLPDHRMIVETPVFSAVEAFPRGVLFGQIAQSARYIDLDHSLIVETSRNVEFVHSNRATVNEVNDLELFALFPNEPVGFVQTTHGKKLFFFADAKPSRL